MATLKMGSTTMLTESSGALTINASNPTVTLGSNTTFPTGHVLQVLNNQYSVASTQISSGEITSGLSQAITPITGSDILVVMSLSCNMSANGAKDFNITLKRGGSVIQTWSQLGRDDNNSSPTIHCSPVFLDTSPTAGSANTYTVFGQPQSGSFAFNYDGGTSTITLFEIAG